jgi:hypothetical protein
MICTKLKHKKPIYCNACLREIRNGEKYENTRSNHGNLAYCSKCSQQEILVFQIRRFATKKEKKTWLC